MNQLSPHSISIPSSDSDSVSTQPPLQLVACAQFQLQAREGQVSSFQFFSLSFFGAPPGLINASMLVLRNHNDDDDRNQMIITGLGTRLRLRLGLRLGRRRLAELLGELGGVLMPPMSL